MTLKSKDYRTDASVVWCPGCGDYGVMRALADALTEQQIPREDIAFISGIGCSSRIPGYFDVFGFNTLHGRALPIAQGVKIARPDLTVLVATGDGDALAIGAGHFMHAGRRNTDITVVLFDNQIYGLTKGQASPTSPKGDKVKLAPFGVPEQPMLPVSLAVSLGATFVARGFSGDVKHLTKILGQGMQHRGFSMIQVLSPCVTFRGKFDPSKTVKEKKSYVPDDHDRTDKFAAMALAEREDSIYLGVFFENENQPTFGDLLEGLGDSTAAKPPPPVEDVLKDFIQ